MKKTYLTFLLLVFTTTQLQAIVIQGQGKTFPIIEPDMLDQIHAEAGKAKWRPTKAKMKTIVENFVPKDNVVLPVATKTAEREFIYWSVLDHEVLNEDGSVLYPKGFTYNTLAYINLPQKILLLDLSIDSHKIWAESKGFFTDPSIKILSQGGSYLKLAKSYKGFSCGAERIF